MVLVDYDEHGGRADLAEEAARCLNNRPLEGKVPARKRRRLDEHSARKTAARKYLVRPTGVAKFEGMKLVIVLDDHGLGKDSKNNGIGIMHHFRFEKALKEQFVCCPMTCFCSYCKDRLKKPTPEERYRAPRSGCRLWPIMEIFDKEGNSTGKGYNDWRYGTFKQRNDSENAQYHAALHGMNVKTGERYSKEIGRGASYGAYMVNDPETPFYIVEWEGKPWRAEDDGEEVVSGHTYNWRKGDYLCRGNWLDKLVGTSAWYTLDVAGRQCIVKLDQVVNADLDLRAVTDGRGKNPLPSRMPRGSKARALKDGAWRMSDSDYTFLMEEVELRE